jgi:hypothetical protein
MTLDCALKSHYPILFELTTNKNDTVTQIIGYNRFYIQFNRSLNDTLTHQLNTLYNILSTIHLDTTEDVIRWRWCNKGLFSIHSCYQWLILGE